MPRNPRRPAPAHSASFVGGGIRIDNLPPGYRVGQNSETGEVIVAGPANESGQSTAAMVRFAMREFLDRRRDGRVLAVKMGARKDG